MPPSRNNGDADRIKPVFLKSLLPLAEYILLESSGPGTDVVAGNYSIAYNPPEFFSTATD
jgi:hypothetical protein